MPVSIFLDGDPVFTFATAPLPDGLDEFLLAGYLRKKSVELVKCETNDLEVPANADFIIEGYVDPTEPLRDEGPFGDHTGYYTLPEPYPVFHVTAITHRKDAVYPATIVGIPPMEDFYIGGASVKLFLPIFKMNFPEIVDIALPAEGVFHNLVFVSIRKTYPMQAYKIMHGLWGMGQMMFTKYIVVVDDDVNVEDRLAPVAAIHDVVDGAGILDSQLAGHGGRLLIQMSSFATPGVPYAKSDHRNNRDRRRDVQQLKRAIPSVRRNTEDSFNEVHK